MVVDALFNGYGPRVLSWSADGKLRLWEIPSFDDVSIDAINDIRLAFEVRTAAMITEQGAYRLLSYDEWLEKRKQLHPQIGDGGITGTVTITQPNRRGRTALSWCKRN